MKSQDFSSYFLYFTFSFFAPAATAQVSPADCIAVALEQTGSLSFVKENGAAMMSSPIATEKNIVLASLSPDRQKLATYKSSNPEIITISSTTDAPQSLAANGEKTLGYAINDIRWESNDIIRLSRGRYVSEYQFLKLGGWPATPSLRNMLDPMIGIDCIMIGASALCTSKDNVKINGIPFLQPTTRPQQAMLAQALGQLTVVNLLGPTVSVLPDPPISVSLASIDTVAGVVRANFTNPAFGFIDTYLRTGEFAEMIIGDLEYRITLKALTARSATFVASWVPNGGGFLEYQHLIVLGTVDAGWLLYSRRDNNGTQRIGLAATLTAPANAHYKFNVVADARLPRVRSTSSIRGARSAMFVQVDDTDGSYILPVAMQRKDSSIGPVVVGGTAYYLPDQIPGHPGAKILEWNCR